MTNPWFSSPWKRFGVAVGCFYVPALLLAGVICWFDWAETAVFFAAGYGGSVLADNYLSRKEEER